MKYQGLALAVASLFLVVSFQNCKSESSSLDPLGIASKVTGVVTSADDKAETDTGGGGGDGGVFDGKPYVSIDVAGTCGAVGGVRTEIRIFGDKAMLLKDNCQEITPKQIDTVELSLMAHNISNIVYEGKVLDAVEEAVDPTRFFCRGSRTKTYEDGSAKGVGDIAIRADVKGEKFFANFKFGEYMNNDKTPFRKFASSDIPINQLKAQDQARRFHTYIEVGKVRHTLYVSINLKNMKGWLRFSKYGLGDPKDGQVFNRKSPFQNKIFVSCVKQ